MNGNDANDSDGDGVCDSLDRYPGADDAVDTDGDCRPDGCDNCPTNANNGQTDVDGDGIVDACDTCTDIDGDGAGDAGFTNTASAVSNGPDNCRFVAKPTQTDTDLDGLGNQCDVCVSGDNAADSDSDGVCDSLDGCRLPGRQCFPVDRHLEESKRPGSRVEPVTSIGRAVFRSVRNAVAISVAGSRTEHRRSSGSDTRASPDLRIRVQTIQATMGRT